MITVVKRMRQHNSVGTAVLVVIGESDITGERYEVSAEITVDDATAEAECMAIMNEAET